MENQTNRYEEKKQARIDYYKGKSYDAQKKSESLYGESSKMIGAIPLGQPILVGHHSEKSDRNYRERAHNKFVKSINESDKSDYYAEKAQAAENNNSISSDDPNALEKLTKKLETLKTYQEEMKNANAYYRKHKTMKGYADLSDHDANNFDEKIKSRYSGQQKPYPAYLLQNNNANMKNIKDRIKSLEEISKISEDDGWEFDGGKVVMNLEENRVQILFDGKPDEEKRKELKIRSFNWSRYHMAWQRQLNKNSIGAAKQIKFIQPITGEDAQNEK